MSISTYADLQTAVANWTKRDDLTSIIPDLILIAEKYLFRHARTRDMETALSGTTASGVVAVPADYVELKYAYIPGSPVHRLKRKDPGWIYENYPIRSGSHTPEYIARDAGNFIFGNYPSDGLTLAGTYYKRLTSIQSSANALFTNNPDLYLSAALAETFHYLRNPNEFQFWSQKREQILADVNSEDKREFGAGGTLSVSAK